MINPPPPSATVRERVLWRLGFRRRVDALPDHERAEALRADRELCRRSFEYWVDRHGWIFNPHADADDPYDQPFVLWPKQRELAAWVLDQVDDGEEDSISAVPKARKIGITWTLLNLIYWLCWTRPGFTALVISRGQRQVDQVGDLDSLMEKLRYIHRNQPAHLRPAVHSPHMRFLFTDTGSAITGETTNEGAGQGGRKSIVLVDEAARIKSMESLILSTNSVGPRVLVYNPGQPGHITHRYHLGKSGERLPDHRLMPIDWHGNPNRTPAWWDGLLIENGGTYTRAHRASSYSLAYGYAQSATIWEPPALEADWILDVDAPETAATLERLQAYMLVGALDYGSGASSTAGVFAAWDPDEGGPYGTYYVIHDPTWERRKVSTEMGPQLRAWIDRWAAPVDIVGDPTGEAPDAEQLSWRERFQAQGVPVVSLPADANKMEAQEWAIAMLQTRLDSGRIRVLSSCTAVIACVQEWRRNLPPGVTVEESGRGYVPPVKDRHSHTGDCLCYVEQRIAQLVRALHAGGVEDHSWTPSLDAADIAWGGMGSMGLRS